MTTTKATMAEAKATTNDGAMPFSFMSTIIRFGEGLFDILEFEIAKSYGIAIDRAFFF